MALLWEYHDGYLAGIPAWLQRATLGVLARLARRTGYEDRWLARTAVPTAPVCSPPDHRPDGGR
ncbi:hypothetical protein [Nocardia sp. NPDC050406]|uniref:hypothetical protein n=1 Tax=Nocardia sp. NPDC050406 TaxID=3364318 RepID=UPI0037B5682F